METACDVCDDSHVDRTVLVVDDHAAFRAAARRLLELDGLRVVGEAADGATAIELVPALAPDIVLLDVGLPDVSGFDVADRLAGGKAAVVFISSRAPGDLGRRMRSSGALGFIPKDELTGEGVLRLWNASA